MVCSSLIWGLVENQLFYAFNFVYFFDLKVIENLIFVFEKWKF